jgi:DNA-binding transcriptional LysR family regulator
VSLQIKRLEKALGGELFHRTTRRIALTEHGSSLLETSIPHLRRALDAIITAPRNGAELSGALRIGCTINDATQMLSRHVVEFSALHPKVKIELRASDRMADLVSDGIDVALRMGWLTDSSLRAIKLGSFRQMVVASPAYLKKAGTPKHPEELARHSWIALSLLTAPLTWKFTSAANQSAVVRMKAHISTDNPSSLRSIVEAGGGTTICDEVSAADSIKAGRLIQLLPKWTLPEGGYYAVFPPGRHLPRQVQAFVDFYRGKLLQNALR